MARAGLLAAAIFAARAGGSPGADRPSPGPRPEIRIGGEIQVDYFLRLTRGSPEFPSVRAADLTVRRAGLRIQADVRPGVSARFKIDLRGGPDPARTQADILEEAILALGAAGGAGWSFYAGKGRAPYGQDVTLGLIQSYHHLANRNHGSHGPISILEEAGDRVADPGRPGGTLVLPIPRPGQLDRVFLAGAALESDSIWRAELAVFQPSREEYDSRLKSGSSGNGSNIGAAGRFWWRPFESLTLEASAVLAHSDDMGRAWLRTDLPAGTPARKNASALSLGFDWRRDPWRVFGEYQRGWNWNHSRDHAVDAGQLGLARYWRSGWRLGGMAEVLRAGSGQPAGKVDTLYKLALNVKYAAPAGWFVMAEYGREWLRRDQYGKAPGKDSGEFAGLRVGLTF
jgi:hypothetical protein